MSNMSCKLLCISFRSSSFKYLFNFWSSSSVSFIYSKIKQKGVKKQDQMKWNKIQNYEKQLLLHQTGIPYLVFMYSSKNVVDKCQTQKWFFCALNVTDRWKYWRYKYRYSNDLKKLPSIFLLNESAFSFFYFITPKLIILRIVFSFLEFFLFLLNSVLSFVAPLFLRFKLTNLFSLRNEKKFRLLSF